MHSSLTPVPNDDAQAFLCFDEVVILNEAINAKTAEVVSPAQGETECARALFEWVRDLITHTKDVDGEVVTCTSVEVFDAGTGLCYAKAHLLAAMMRSVGIPCGFCYQVFENAEAKDLSELALHGLNAIWLKETGRWHRIDPRGNGKDVHADFSLGKEVLAFPKLAFLDDCVYAEPLTAVVRSLRKAESISALWPELPLAGRLAGRCESARVQHEDG